MLVYFLNIFLIIVWALIFRIGKRSRVKDVIYVVICFCQMFLISAFRFRVGYDFDQYGAGFFKMALDGFSNMAYEDWEIGYILLNKIVGIFTRDYRVMMVVTSFLSLLGPAYLISKYSKSPFISVFLYANLYLFYLDMNYVRQAVAMSVLCFAYGFIRDKKFWRFLLLALLATSFHFTAVYIIAVYFVSLLKINSRTFLLYLFGLFYYYMLSDGFLRVLLTKFHTEYMNSYFIRTGLYFHYAVIPLILAFAMVLLSYYVRNIPRTLEMAVHFTLMTAFWQVVMTKHMLFERFSYYTTIFLVVALPEAIHVFRSEIRNNLREKYLDKFDSCERKKTVSRAGIKKRTSIVILCTVFSILALSFAYNILGLLGSAEGAHGVLPYDSYFSFEIPSIDAFFKN